MKAAVLVTALNILAFASAHPTPARNDHEGCLDITPERQKQIRYIENEISNLLMKLENKFEDIYITDVTVNIKKYLEAEAENETTLSVNIFDCATNPAPEEVFYEEYKKIDSEKSKNDKDVPSKNTDSTRDVNKEVDETQQNKNVELQDNENTASEITKDSYENEDYTNEQAHPKKCNKRPRNGMEVVFIKLNNKEEKLVREMEKKKGKKVFLLIENGKGQRKMKFF